MARIAFIGAGSMVFATTLVGDILSFDELSDSTIVLMDVDDHRLEQTRKVADAIVDNENLDATVESTTDRREALDGADYVLNMINVGGTEPFENEIRIPEKYGVEQAIGDTTGPGGNLPEPPDYSCVARHRSRYRGTLSQCAPPQLHKPNGYPL